MTPKEIELAAKCCGCGRNFVIATVYAYCVAERHGGNLFCEVCRKKLDQEGENENNKSMAFPERK